MTKEYFSIGEYCTTAFQIRRYHEIEDAFLYDWLVTHEDAIGSILCPDDEFLVEGFTAIVDSPPVGSEGSLGGIRLLDLKTRLKYQHEFPQNMNEVGIWGHPIDADKVSSHLPVAREKFVYLKNKTLANIRSSDSPVLVRCEHGLADFESAKIRSEQISSIFIGLNSNIQIAIVSQNFKDIMHYQNSIMYPVNVGEDWMGEGSSWDGFFQYMSSLDEIR